MRNIDHEYLEALNKLNVSISGIKHSINNLATAIMLPQVFPYMSELEKQKMKERVWKQLS